VPDSPSVQGLNDDLVGRLKRRAPAQEADPVFDGLAAELRTMTQGRHHTPAEALLREGRDER
jgi:hypothetical protein